MAFVRCKICSIYRYLFQISRRGGVAQMVERSLSMREVRGSMPLSSISFSFFGFFFFIVNHSFHNCSTWFPISSMVLNTYNKTSYRTTLIRICLITIQLRKQNSFSVQDYTSINGSIWIDIQLHKRLLVNFHPNTFRIFKYVLSNDS